MCCTSSCSPSLAMAVSICSTGLHQRGEGGGRGAMKGKHLLSICSRQQRPWEITEEVCAASMRPWTCKLFEWFRR